MSRLATIFICLHYSYIGSTFSPFEAARQFDIFAATMTATSSTVDNGDFAVINGHTVATPSTLVDTLTMMD
eukprot:2702756-Amphidinium_carterae.1